MADQSQHSACGKKSSTSAPDSQLEYPQLLIEASFESLLSHSQSSAPRTVVHMPRSEVSLSESWSSLSEHDLSHDDDFQSEATDTGSLIDVSTAGDIHTVDDQGQSSEAEPDDEDDHEEVDKAADTCGPKGLRDSATAADYVNTPGQNSIRLDDSTVIVDGSGMTSLQASRSFTAAEMKLRSSQSSQHDGSEMLEETIEIALSPDTMKLTQRPYHILYHGSKYCSPEMKPEVLGKIGAALISVNDQHKLEDQAESPCYHIIPSEFGPGSRPSTTDLIPIPTQMHITECTVLGSRLQSMSDTDICLQLNAGRRVISRRAKLFETPKTQEWTQPDLVVIVVSHNDAQEDRAQAETIARFAKRHRIASICLRQEYSWDGDDCMIGASPHMLLRQVRSDSQDVNRRPLEHITLLDADTFLSLDAEQLNQHLNYLTTSTSLDVQGQAGFSKFLNTEPGKMYRKLLNLLPIGLRDKIPGADTKVADTSQWTICTWPSAAEHDQQPKNVQEKSSRIRSTKEYASILSSLYDAALVMAVTVLAMFMFYACQAAFAHLMSMNAQVPRISMTSHNGAFNCPPSNPPVSVSAATATATPTLNSALSGPLQPIEQQGRDWISASVKHEMADSKFRTSTDSMKQSENFAAEACQKVVSVQISRNLKMSKDFFHAETPYIRVKRGTEEVNAMVQKRSAFTIAVLLKRKDMHGKFTVYLGEGEQKTCAIIDLENLWEESLTLWANSIPETYKKHKRLERLANRWIQLLEVRAPESGLAGNALELKYSAAQGLGAVVEVVEKATVKHARACQKLGEQGLMHMLGLPNQQLMLPVERARQVSEDLIRNAREQVDVATRHSKDRANQAVEQAREEVSKAVQKVQSSIQEFSIYPVAVSKRLAEAQHRAQKLVEKSGLGRRSGRGSA